MSLILKILRAAHCRGTHHYLAFDALTQLDCPNAALWRRLFLYHHSEYLTGSKAPDKSFRDFENHVLHVTRGNWGGAPAEARAWYERTVRFLRQGHWSEAVYGAGVLSHYLTDPLMPFHTDQSEAESNIHRAVEWSIAKSYDSMQQRIDQSLEKTNIKRDESPDWLEDLVAKGARLSNKSYSTLIDRYDFEAGAQDPPTGLDKVCRTKISQLLGYSAALHAHVLGRAIEDAGIIPTRVHLTAKTVFASLSIPFEWVVRRIGDAMERKRIIAMYREFAATGRVDRRLTEDVRVIRDLVAGENGEKPLPKQLQRKMLTSHVHDSGLDLDAPLQAAPSIGPKTARRLARVGCSTVGEFLEADPEVIAKKARARYINVDAVKDWQDQARLAHRIPRLRGHDVQILVGGGIRTLDDLAAASPEEILTKVRPFVVSDQGKRVIRSGDEPDVSEVERWIAWAGEAA